jgi:asparagine synthase (glutamine-hydrolysing)
MLAASPHRGSEVAYRTCGAAILGVSNRADPVDRAAISTPGDFACVLCGTLDNVPDLTDTASGLGFPPRANDNPADVLVAVFRALGPAAASRLRGEFAAVITDGSQMWCVRDHLGFRPLFYRDEPGAVFVATEAKQVLAGAGLGREPDLDVLEQIFCGSMPEDMPSALKGVNRLPKASVVRATIDATSTPDVYWHPDRLIESAPGIRRDEVEERFAHLFTQAVRRNLTGADAVSLSGGIDSSAVAGFAAPLYREVAGRPLPALSIVFPAFPKVDERRHIETITSFLEMDLHTRTLSGRALDDLEQWCDRFDGPMPIINTAQMLEYYAEARKLDFRNILTGDIAECVIDLPMHVTGHLLMHGRWNALGRLLATQRRQGAAVQDLARQLLSPLIPRSVFRAYLAIRGRDAPRRFPVWLDRKQIYHAPFRQDLLVPGRARWSAFQTIPLRGCPITMEGGEMCAALGGVTVRRPFGDIDLWEFFLSLPAETKYPDLRSKTLVRALLRGKVPDSILDRKDKTYFDDHVMAQIDYPLLRRYLANRTYEMRGVDYRLLLTRIEARTLDLVDWVWVKDLVRIHAFLSQW